MGLTMNTKNVMMSTLLFLVISLVPLVKGGSSCRFNGAPKVEQVDIDKVKVSWVGVVPNLGCLDFFVINYWEKGRHKVHDGTPVGPLGANQFSTEIEVTPSQRYIFQLKTTKRSNRSWGESRTVEFKTDRDYDTDDSDGDDDGVLDVDENTDTMAIGIKYYIIASCGVIAGLIVIGIIYKLVCKCACSKKSSADPEKVYSLVENNDTVLNGSAHQGPAE